MVRCDTVRKRPAALKTRNYINRFRTRLRESTTVCAERSGDGNGRIASGASFGVPTSPASACAIMKSPPSCRLAIEMLNVRVSQAKRIVLWAVLGALAALLSYIAFRGYLSPDFLIIFSNAFRC